MKKNHLLFWLIFLTSPVMLKAQNWGGGADENRYNWGFSFQYVSAQYKIDKNAGWNELKPDLPLQYQRLQSISSGPTHGFAAGLVGTRKLGDVLDLRLMPMLVFSEHDLRYQYDSGEPINKSVQATLVDLPLNLILKSERIRNFRAYMTGGLKYSISIRSGTKNAQISDEWQKELVEKPRFLSYEAGAGMDFYFGFFKMSTEFKVSNSFKNIVQLNEAKVFTEPIDRLKLRSFIFSLIFE